MHLPPGFSAPTPNALRSQSQLAKPLSSLLKHSRHYSMLNTRALKPSGPPSGKGLTLSQKQPQKRPPKWPWCLPVISETPGDDRRAPRDREQPRPALGARAGVKRRPLAGPPSPGLHLRGGQSQLPPPPPLPSPGAPAPAGDFADRTRVSSGTIVSFHGIVPCSSSAAMVAEAGRRPPSCWLGLELRFLNTCRPAPPCLSRAAQRPRGEGRPRHPRALGRAGAPRTHPPQLITRLACAFDFNKVSLITSDIAAAPSPLSRAPPSLREPETDELKHTSRPRACGMTGEDPSKLISQES